MHFFFFAKTAARCARGCLLEGSFFEFGGLPRKGKDVYVGRAFASELYVAPRRAGYACKRRAYPSLIVSVSCRRAPSAERRAPCADGSALPKGARSFHILLTLLIALRCTRTIPFTGSLASVPLRERGERTLARSTESWHKPMYAVQYVLAMDNHRCIHTYTRFVFAFFSCDIILACFWSMSMSETYVTKVIASAETAACGRYQNANEIKYFFFKKVRFSTRMMDVHKPSWPSPCQLLSIACVFRHACHAPISAPLQKQAPRSCVQATKPGCSEGQHGMSDKFSF